MTSLLMCFFPIQSEFHPNASYSSNSQELRQREKSANVHVFMFIYTYISILGEHATT